LLSAVHFPRGRRRDFARCSSGGLSPPPQKLGARPCHFGGGRLGRPGATMRETRLLCSLVAESAVHFPRGRRRDFARSSSGALSPPPQKQRARPCHFGGGRLGRPGATTRETRLLRSLVAESAVHFPRGRRAAWPAGSHHARNPSALFFGRKVRCTFREV